MHHPTILAVRYWSPFWANQGISHEKSVGEMEWNCHFSFPRTIHLFTHHSFIYSVNKIVRLSEASRPMPAAKKTRVPISTHLAGPHCVGKGPHSGQTLTSSEFLETQGPCVSPSPGIPFDFIKVWLPQHHTLPRQLGLLLVPSWRFPLLQPFRQ